jgi:hypothetical protein
MNYIKEYARDMAYIAIAREDEPAQQVRKRMCTTLGMMNKPHKWARSAFNGKVLESPPAPHMEEPTWGMDTG